jgi:VIT1/CCC1 family predicted Fe2+/Mn2+ transporter
VRNKKFPATFSDWKVAIATLLIDFVLIFPVIIPYFLIDSVRWAVFVSHAIAIVLLAGIAMIWARNLGLNTRRAGIIIALISFAMIYFTYIIGW